MGIRVESAWKSLNKYKEELCGDKVEIIKTDDSDIVILADGMGSGVKANILATLTSRILATMLKEGADLESCVETVAKTLPICQERQVAYATFSILQIFESGVAHLVEFDNPSCVMIRHGEIVSYPYGVRTIEGKIIHESYFQVEKDDCFVLMSDGVIYAGAGEILNLQGWTWEKMAEYTRSCTQRTKSASRLAMMLSQACDDLYVQRPGDDTTVAVVRVGERKVVNLLTGPPKSKEDDALMMHDFMQAEGKKVVSGGSSANLAARILGKEIVTVFDSTEEEIPPIATIDGLDLVTEGVITLGKAVKLLRKYEQNEFDEEFFVQLDGKNGAARLAKLLLEECTTLQMFVGTSVNEMHAQSGLSFDVSVRMHLIEQLQQIMEKIGKRVRIRYY
jgi:hypothetical protein